MLILAGVSVTTIQNGSLFGKTREARDKTEAEKQREMELGQGLIDGRTLEEITGNFEMATIKETEVPGVLAGTGTEEDPYLIESAEDLFVFINSCSSNSVRETSLYSPQIQVKQVINKVAPDYNNEDVHIKLAQNIDLTNDASYYDPTKSYEEYMNDMVASYIAFNSISPDVNVDLCLSQAFDNSEDIIITSIKEYITTNRFNWRGI